MACDETELLGRVKNNSKKQMRFRTLWLATIKLIDMSRKNEEEELVRADSLFVEGGRFWHLISAISQSCNYFLFFFFFLLSSSNSLCKWIINSSIGFLLLEIAFISASILSVYISRSIQSSTKQIIQVTSCLKRGDIKFSLTTTDRMKNKVKTNEF